jgi:neutral ceramidase
MFKLISFLILFIATISGYSQEGIFSVGLDKTDITIYKKGGGMLGYSMAFNVSERVETKLHARSFVLKDKNSNKVAIVECELCFIPSELKSAIVDILQQSDETHEFNEENVLIMAQHTHCGPAGYCHYASYNMSVPGFIPEIFDWLSWQIAQSIIKANQKIVPCSISLSKGFFPEDWEVAFNRSMPAYNRNEDIIPLPHSERNKAVNREMTLLQFKGENELPLGSLNWFGVHATSISNDIAAINADNKGYAATYLEKHFMNLNPDYVGAFAQGTAGDVTPKFIFNPKRHWQRGYWEGKFPDDVESAKYNGELQFKKALELIESENQQVVSESKIHCVLRYFDFSNLLIDTLYSHTSDVKKTSPSCIGMDMLGGALMDGPAAPKVVVKMTKIWIRLFKTYELTKARFIRNEDSQKIREKYETQGPKAIALETGNKRLLGSKNVKKLPIPDFLDPTIATFKLYAKRNALEEQAWSPQILPIQFVEIGNLVLVNIPFEITTTAGRRLKKGIEDLYATQGGKEVILCPYANSYSGYITTFEEYQEQMYEGGHTVFGQYGLAALQTTFKKLFEVKNIPFCTTPDELCPPVFSESELGKRVFYERPR